jgi:hypothetical protein
MRSNSKLWVFTAVTLAVYLSGSVTHAATSLPMAEFRHYCQHAIQHAEASRALPQDLLSAISFAESGKWDTEKQEIIAWPWTVTSRGKGHYFPDKQAAVAFVRDLQSQGVRNIDVGCLQVNLQYHPDAFSDPEEALDPRTNALYAAKFLAQLHQQNKSWSEAIRRYHSANPDRGDPYRQRVLNFWNKRQRTAAEVYRQSVIDAYKQRRAERRRERNLKVLARTR